MSVYVINLFYLHGFVITREVKLTTRFPHNPKVITPKILWVSLHPCLMKEDET